MFKFTPNSENYATQQNSDYAALISKIRSIYCGKSLRIENGIVTAVAYSDRIGEPKVVGTIVKA